MKLQKSVKNVSFDSAPFDAAQGKKDKPSEPDLTFEQALQIAKLSSVPDLLERLEVKTGADVWILKSIPATWKPYLESIAVDKSAPQLQGVTQNSVQGGNSDEIVTRPILEETPPPKTRRRKGGDLTKKQTEAIANNKQSVENLQTGDVEIQRQLAVQKGIVLGSQLLSLEYQAQQGTYYQLKGELLCAQINKEKALIESLATDFDPNAYLTSAGIQLPGNALAATNAAAMAGMQQIQEMADEIRAVSFNLQSETVEN